MKNLIKSIGTAISIVCLTLCTTVVAQELPQLQKEEIKQMQLDEIRVYQHKKSLKNKTTRTITSTTMPYGVNPFTSFHSENKGSAHEWRNYLQKMSQSIHKKNKNKNAPVTINEIENVDQYVNNTIHTAQNLPNFGSADYNINTIIVNGVSKVEDENVIENYRDTVSNEDNGAIPLAELITFDNNPDVDVDIVGVSGFLDDGPHGSAGTGTGDFDVYAIELEANATISMVVESPIGTFVSIYNEAGNFLRPNDSFMADGNPGELLRILSFTAPETGVYYFNIGSVNIALENPFDPTSGAVFVPNAPLESGPYLALFFNYGVTDQDHYAINLKKGDVFGVDIDNSTRFVAPFISVLLPDGSLQIGTNTRSNVSIAEENPIPNNGRSNFVFIAPRDGRYIVRIDKTIGNYRAELVVSRPGYETNNKGFAQYIYLDFTGVENITLRDFLGVPDDQLTDDDQINKKRNLTPFRGFLENWGIENNDTNNRMLAYYITDVVANALDNYDLHNINPDLDLVIISDYGSEFLGQEIPKMLASNNVPYSRVIIGGTKEEFGISTVGIATGIDTGNYSLEDDAVVLLGDLSDTNTSNETSIANIPRADGVTIEDVMPVVVGNIVAHEAGHYLGNHHCDTFNERVSIMNEGGDLAITAGIIVGNGEKFGDANTRFVSFNKDEYSLSESLFGINHTDVNTAFAIGFRPNFRSEKPAILEKIQFLEEKVIKELFDKIDTLEVVSYPNPQSQQEISHLIFSSKEKGPVTISLYDMQGRKIDKLFSGVIKKGEKKEIELITSKYNLSSGIYVYKITTPNKEINHKFSIK